MLTDSILVNIYGRWCLVMSIRSGSRETESDAVTKARLDLMVWEQFLKLLEDVTYEETGIHHHYDGTIYSEPEYLERYKPALVVGVRFINKVHKSRLSIRWEEAFYPSLFVRGVSWTLIRGKVIKMVRRAIEGVERV
jgi:hypothetical protein